MTTQSETTTPGEESPAPAPMGVYIPPDATPAAIFTDADAAQVFARDYPGAVVAPADAIDVENADIKAQFEEAAAAAEAIKPPTAYHEVLTGEIRTALARKKFAEQVESDIEAQAVELAEAEAKAAAARMSPAATSGSATLSPPTPPTASTSTPSTPPATAPPSGAGTPS